ncbi:hypothetical protein PanWU01x14_108830 [Parasponia andersonii]|uniref:Glabrous enhancer-binding protein-like DBD domain-containing protein n=1 Tax=Parasponia andersonii TaxID=3476 RepID=A0A2P5D036_PARAD|nr:hypothetical protein PanWU01x14_108830 [Parasponia andersonii]
MDDTDHYNSIVPDSADDYERPSEKKAKLTAEEKMKQVDDAHQLKQASQIILFSQDDQILLLQGLIAFSEKHGKNRNFAEIYDVIKKSLPPNMSMKQLRRQVSRMERKFVDHELKKCDGGSPTFANPHDQKVYELSKIIWGNSTTTSTTTTTTNTTVVHEDHRLQDSDDIDTPLSFVLKDFVTHNGLDLNWVEESKRKHLARMWKKYKIAECNYFHVRAKFQDMMHHVKMQVYNRELARQ